MESLASQGRRIHRLIVWWSRILVAAAGLFLSTTVSADGHRDLTLREVLRLADRSPSLGPARAEVATAEGLAAEADVLVTSPPQVSLMVGPRYVAVEGTTRPEVAIALSQSIPLRSQRDARGRVAATALRLGEAGLEMSAAFARLDAALAWVDARVARSLVELRKRSLADAEQLAALGRARIEAGATSPLEGALAQTVVGRARAELLRARGMEHEASTRLRYAVGLGPDVEARATGPLALSLVRDAGPRLAQVAALKHPRLALAGPTAELARAQAELALASAAPSVTFGPSVTREGTGDWLVVAQVSVPLPIVEPGAFAAAQARRRAAVVEAQHERAQAEVTRDVELARHHRDHAGRERRLLEAEALAPAREAMRITQAQYDAGVVELAEVLAVRREHLAAESRWLDATAELLRAEVRLAFATGQLEAFR